MKPDYVSTPSRKAKNKLVRATVESIQANNGRFLTKLSKGERKMLGHPWSSHKTVYEVVQDSVAFEKTKQAIRYVHYKKDPTSATKKKPAATVSASADSDRNDDKDYGLSPAKKRRADPMTGQQRREYSTAAGGGQPAGRGSGDDASGTKNRSSDESGRADRSGLASLLSSNVHTPVGNQMNPVAFAASQPPQIPRGNSFLPNASVQQMLSDSFASHPPASLFSLPVGSPNLVGSPNIGGYPWTGLSSLPLSAPPATLQHARLGNSLRPQADSSSSPAAAPAAGDNIYNRRLSQSLPAGGGAPASLPSNNWEMPTPSLGTSVSAHIASGTASNPPTDDPEGLPTGLFQQALENEQLRSVLLSHDRYRHIIESMLSQRNSTSSNDNRTDRSGETIFEERRE